MDMVLINRLSNDFPEIKFKLGEKFLFIPPKTIAYNTDEPNASLLLMHELGHFLCGHRDFKMAVSRLKMEREAWEKAREICAKYDVFYDDEVVETELDTYRDWLNQKSRCPDCGLTRFQTPDGRYHCPRCENF